MTFRAGMKVICIDNHGASQLALNGKYTIKAIHDDECAVKWRGKLVIMASVWLYEAEPEGGYHGFAIARFRPAVDRKTDISVFKKLLTKRSYIVNDDGKLVPYIVDV